jgi:hypothetical protein
VLLFQIYNIILYVHAFLFCWHFSYRTCAFCKACSDWLQLPLAALHINRHRVTSKIRLTMPRVKMSSPDRNPWLAKMKYCLVIKTPTKDKKSFYAEIFCYLMLCPSILYDFWFLFWHLQTFLNLKICTYVFMAIFYQGRKYGHWLIHNPSRFVFKSIPQPQVTVYLTF